MTGAVKILLGIAMYWSRVVWVSRASLTSRSREDRANS